jgi:ATP phosphoribosyltransferase
MRFSLKDVEVSNRGGAGPGPAPRFAPGPSRRQWQVVRTHDRLRIAIQKSGRLSDPARDLLARAGLAFRESRIGCSAMAKRCRSTCCWFATTTSRPDRRRRLRPRHRRSQCRRGAARRAGCNGIERGLCRAGAAGFRALPAGDRGARRNVVDRQRLPAGHAHRDQLSEPAQRLAARQQFAGRGRGAVRVGGNRPRLGKADAICDLVSSGATLQANQLKEVAVVLDSEAVLIGPATPFTDARAELAALLRRRLDGVLSVRASKLLLLQARRSALPEILKLLPDAEPPTVTTIEGRIDDVCLQALCRSTMTWQRLEDIKRAGASGLLVLPVEQMLA